MAGATGALLRAARLSDGDRDRIAHERRVQEPKPTATFRISSQRIVMPGRHERARPRPQIRGKHPELRLSSSTGYSGAAARRAGVHGAAQALPRCRAEPRHRRRGVIAQQPRPLPRRQRAAQLSPPRCSSTVERGAPSSVEIFSHTARRVVILAPERSRRCDVAAPALRPGILSNHTPARAGNVASWLLSSIFFPNVSTQRRRAWRK